MEKDKRKFELVSRKHGFIIGGIVFLILALLLGSFLLIQKSSEVVVVDSGEEIEETEFQEGIFEPRKVNTFSEIQNTKFEIRERGELIGFLDTVGAFHDNNTIKIILTTNEKEELVQNTETTKNYYLVLEDFEVDENIKEATYRRFLEVLYDENIDQELDGVSREEFVDGVLSTPGGQEFFEIGSR